MRKLIRWTMLVMALGVLAACGGGGGGDDGPSIEDELSAPQSPPPAATGDLSLANYESEALTLSRVILNSGEAGQALESALGVSKASSSVTVLHAIQRATSQLIEKNAALELPFKVYEETGSCAGGGSVDFALSYKSDSATSVGDKATFIFNNCVEDGVTLTGGYSVRLTRYDAEGSYTARVAFVNFSDQTTTLHGWADLDTQGQGFSATISAR